MDKTREKYLYYMFLTSACLVILQRFSINGLYYPVMDDWFIFGDTYTWADKVTDFIAPNGKFAIRPLAGAVDIFFAAPLFNHLWAVELILTLLLLSGVFLMLGVLRENDFSAGGIFILLLCLLPLNMEATYWLAASIRISNSMFFSGLSAWLLQRYLKTEKKRFLIGYCATGFGAVGFYEPAVVIYMFFAAYLPLKKENKKHLRILLITAVHIISVILYYIGNSSSPAMERGALITSGIISHSADVTKMMADILFPINTKTFKLGLERGINLLIQKKALVQSLAVMIYSVLFGVFAGRLHSGERRFMPKKILPGLLLTLGGALVFYILKDSRITVRSTYFVFVGFGVIIEEILMLLPYCARRIIIPITVSVLSAVFVVSGMGTVDKYQNISQTDRNIVSQIVSMDKNNQANETERKIYLFGAVSYYSDIETPEYFENIRGACSGYSEMTGCMWHFDTVTHKTNITPVKNGEQIKLKNIETPANRAFFALGNDRIVMRVSIKKSGEIFEILDENNRLYGTLKNTGGEQYLFETV